MNRILSSHLNILLIIKPISGYFNRRITEKRQKEKARLKNTFLFKEKEREEEGDSLSSLNCSSPPIHNIFLLIILITRSKILPAFFRFFPLLSTVICTAFATIQ